MIAIDTIYPTSLGLANWCHPWLLVFEFKHISMKAFSLFLMVVGWFLVMTAIAMLKPGFIPAFAVAGLLVELLGLSLLTRTQAVSLPTSRRERRH